MKNVCLRPRHWQQIRKIAKVDFDETSKDFTLEAIIEMKLQVFIIIKIINLFIYSSAHSLCLFLFRFFLFLGFRIRN